MSKRTARIMTHLNQTGHVQGLRARIRDRFDSREAVEWQRMLDSIMERAIELASDDEPMTAVRTTPGGR